MPDEVLKALGPEPERAALEAVLLFLSDWGGRAVNVIRVTEAKAQLSALMARAGFGGERFLIKRRGKPLAGGGCEDLERLEGERGGSGGGRWWGRGEISRKTGGDRHRTYGGSRNLTYLLDWMEE